MHWHVRLHKLSWFHELGGKSSPQSSGNTSKKASNICCRYQRVTWWDTMQMALDKTSECDDRGARESMIMGLLHHAEPWPTLLFLCGCFVKQTARGADYWRAERAVICCLPNPKAVEFPYWSARHGVLCLRSVPGCWCCSSDTLVWCYFKINKKKKETPGSCCFTVRLCNQQM